MVRNTRLSPITTSAFIAVLSLETKRQPQDGRGQPVAYRIVRVQTFIPVRPEMILIYRLPHSRSEAGERLGRRVSLA